MIPGLVLTLVFPLMSRIQIDGRNLLEAAKQGDDARVTSLIGSGVRVDTTDEYRRTPLLLAAQAGHVETVRLLLGFGARVDARNELGATPLMLASLNSNFDVVRLLVEKGADVNVRSSNGMTALMLAVVIQERNSLDIVKLFIERGAGVDVADETGRTALMHAVFSPPQPPPPPSRSNKVANRWFTEIQARVAVQKEIVSLLIKVGSSLTAQDHEGNTAVSLAKQCHQREILELLDAASKK